MAKIKVEEPVVELNRDEMTRIIWSLTRSRRSSPGHGGPEHCGNLDQTPAVVDFAETLERVCIETVESGRMTKDLALLVGPDQEWLTTEDFLAAVDENLRRRMTQ
jgi:isocitrate dehydrogenase